MEQFDLVVIGASWYGLSAAKTYLELHPTASILILEQSATAGGTWAQHRIYESLRTNNMLGMFHYPDFPMDEATFGVKPGEHIPGHAVHQYLVAFAKKFGVHAKIRFQTKVETVEPHYDHWLLTTSNTSDTDNARFNHPSAKVVAERLVVATGLTSNPRMPDIPGMETFGAPLWHVKDYCSRAQDPKPANSVVILGCGKAAMDVAYDFASAGVIVDMIVRKSGRGPVWIAPPYVTPLKMWLEKLLTTRMLTWFSPCTWGDEDGYPGVRSYLHGTAIGRWVVEKYWRTLEDDVVALNGFKNNANPAKLRPWHATKWEGNSISIFNSPTDILDLVRDGTIRVHVADVSHLSEQSVHLTNGDSLSADALICATGWKHKASVKFVGISDQQLGLPYASPEPEIGAGEADMEVLTRFPSLRNQPDISHKDPDGLNHPYRLFRFLVPPALIGKRNLAFAGMTGHTITPMVAHVQSLWLSAYFDGKLDRVPTSNREVERETMLHTQSLVWRYPLGFGAKHPDFGFDSIPYIDQLLADMNLQRWRKNGWLAEMTEPYSPEDYATLVDEWKETHRWEKND